MSEYTETGGNARTRAETQGVEGISVPAGASCGWRGARTVCIATAIC